jgi:L-malate glycosyltransferase
MSRILRGLDRSEFEITWMGFGEPNPALLSRAGAAVDVVSFEKHPSPLKIDPVLLASIAEAVRAKRPDIVHAHNWSVSVYGIVGARLGGAKKVIYEAAGRELPEGPTPRQRALMRSLAPLVDRFTSVADFLSDELRSAWAAPHDRVITMPTGVDLARIDAVSKASQRARFGVPEGAIVVGSLGMIRAVKRIEDLIDAAGIVARQDPRIVLLAIGNALRIEPEELRARARSVGLGDRFILPGRVEDSHAAVHAIDVFVSSSEFEGRSNAIIEALAAGIPVVATAVGGSPELVTDGENGFLVPPRDVLKLAAAIERLTRDAELRARLSQNAKVGARARYDEREMVRAYSELFRSVASEPSKSSVTRAFFAARGILNGIQDYVSR